MLIDEIKKANIEAMKARDQIARGVLSVVLTKSKLLEVELKAKGQDLADSNVLEIIQKTLKELSDEKEGYLKVNNTEKVDSIVKQEVILKAFLPKQLTKEEQLEYENMKLRIENEMLKKGFLMKEDGSYVKFMK